jgi:uncharacterized protein YndB with AHSA1/START domain
MNPVRVSVTIDRPREDLFALLSDLRAHEQFTDHFLVDYSGEAEHVRARAKLPGPEQWAEISVVENAEPSRLVERAVGAGGRRETRGTYRLEPAASGGTVVTFDFETIRAPAAERAMGPVLRRWVRRQNARAMERLKAVAESPAGSCAP